MQQLEIFKPAPNDPVYLDGIAHWTHMAKTEGKRWPKLLPWYLSMIEWNRLRLDVGHEAAGCAPKHPSDDDDDFGCLPVSRGFLARAEGEWLRVCKQVNQRSFDCWLPATGNYI